MMSGMEQKSFNKNLLAVLLVVLVLSGAIFFYFKNKSYTISLTSSEGKVTKFVYGEVPELSNPDFFGKIKTDLVDKKTDFIEADLSAMKVSVYKNGEKVLEVPIKTKGREGSWWETPAGLYKIATKEKSHFSSMGHVYQPWSMQFQGNFFIHGWPYYPDGKDVASTYSGGCIRLETEDAKKVFDLVNVGTPILVFENDFSTDNFSYEEGAATLSAKSFLSADLKNNHVFAKKTSEEVVPIASLTKLMTALIATEYINLDNIATVPKEAIIYTSRPRLTVGSKQSIYTLLFPLLMESSNEAAETISRYYGRDGFIQHMNEKALAIGMTHTHFADASGVSPENVSTAEDLFMLAKYIFNNRSFIFHITSGSIQNSIYGESGFADIQNFNDFVGQKDFFGGKNGKTEAAEQTNLSVFNMKVGEITRPVVVIVLGSQDARADAQALYNQTTGQIR